MRTTEPRDPALTWADALDALPLLAYMVRPNGSLSYLSRGWSELTGQDRNAILGVSSSAVVHPDHLDRITSAWDAARASGTAFHAECAIRTAGGSYRWMLNHADPVREPGTDELAGWFGTLTDIDDRKRAEDALRAQAEFNERLIDSSDDCIKILDLDARLVSMSPNGRKLLRIKDFASVEGAYWIDFWTGADRVAALAAVDAARGGGTGRFSGYFPVEGEPRWFDVVVTPIADAQGRPERLLAVSRDVTVTRAAEVTRRTVEQGLRLLSRTGAATLDSLDPSDTLHNIVRAVAAEFATMCTIDVLDGDDRWERVALAHRDPRGQRLLEHTRALSQPLPEHPVARALHDGQSSVVTIDAAWAERIEGHQDRIDAIRVLGVRSFLTVPVATPTGTIAGALSCIRDIADPNENYRDEDLAFVEEVGRRAGAAIANAQLYERERRIAVRFQAASLPAALPATANLQLDAEYRPGSDEATIGGDWYDAFALEDGRVAITVGDVLGHGLHAAVTMTKLRQAMQSAAMIRPDPNAMLTVADKTLRRLDPDGYATAVAAIYDPRAQTFTFASAGHPGPVLRTPDGRVEEFDGTGSMLGLRHGNEREVIEMATPPGSAVVLFTDGLVEATRDPEQGRRRLRDALARSDVVHAEHPARAIVESVLDGRDASDDIAVLVARIGPS
jgi:PAS domain S-box-containing protein